MPGLLTDCIKVSEIATSKIITDIPAAGSSLNISFKTFSNLCLAQCQCLCVCVRAREMTVCVCVCVCVVVCVLVLLVGVVVCVCACVCHLCPRTKPAAVVSPWRARWRDGEKEKEREDRATGEGVYCPACRRQER